MALNRQKLIRRVWTAAAGILVMCLFVGVLPAWCLHILLIALCGVGIHEFEDIAAGFGYKLYPSVIFLSVALGIATLYTDHISVGWVPYIVVACCGLVSLVPPSDFRKTMPQFGLTLLASAYLSLALVSMAYLFSIDHQPNYGRLMVAFCLLMVWAGDTAAYFIGSMLGKHLIAPMASPKKTYEGTIGNLLGNFLMAWLAKTFFFTQMNVFDTIVLALVFGLLGFYGDIIESTWKRGADIKDSGRLFPGHGGLLDRIDSIFLTAPVLYLYMTEVVFTR